MCIDKNKNIFHLHKKTDDNFDQMRIFLRIFQKTERKRQRIYLLDDTLIINSMKQEDTDRTWVVILI